MPKETKANKATAEARLNKVYEYLVAGMPRYHIWQNVTDPKSKDYATFKDISRRQLDRYIHDANIQMAEEAEFYRPREYGRAVARLNGIFYASMKVQDYQRAISAQRELNQLMGLYAPTKSELKLTGDTEIMLTRLLGEMEAQNVDAATVFNSLLAKLAAQKVENG